MRDALALAGLHLLPSDPLVRLLLRGAAHANAQASAAAAAATAASAVAASPSAVARDSTSPAVARDSMSPAVPETHSFTQAFAPASAQDAVASSVGAAGSMPGGDPDHIREGASSAVSKGSATGITSISQEGLKGAWDGSQHAQSAAAQHAQSAVPVSAVSSTARQGHDARTLTSGCPGSGSGGGGGGDSAVQWPASQGVPAQLLAAHFMLAGKGTGTAIASHSSHICLCEPAVLTGTTSNWSTGFICLTA